MSFPAYADREGSQARLLMRLRGGAWPSALCREARWPSWACFRVWARGDAGFAAALAEARAAGAAVRAGARVRAKARAAKARAAKAREAGARAPGRRGRRYRPYDPAVGERLYARLWMGGASLREIPRSEREFPSLSVLARWRREQPAFDGMLTFVMGAWRRKVGVRGDYTPELAEAVLDGIVEGGSLRSLGTRPDLPCAGTLYAWVRTRPEFAAAVAQACVDREDIYVDHIVEIARQAPAIGARAARRRMAPLSKQLTRLKKRPGWKGRRGVRAGPTPPRW